MIKVYEKLHEYIKELKRKFNVCVNNSLLYEGWGLSHGNFFFFCKIDKSWRNMEIYKCEWMVLGALGCMNNADFEEN